MYITTATVCTSCVHFTVPLILHLFVEFPYPEPKEGTDPRQTLV